MKIYDCFVQEQFDLHEPLSLNKVGNLGCCWCIRLKDVVIRISDKRRQIKLLKYERKIITRKQKD